MAGGGPIVNQRVAFFIFQELGDIGHSDFHFKRGGYSVERLDPLALEILTVLMEIDESGGNYEPLGRNDAASAEWVR